MLRPSQQGVVWASGCGGGRKPWGGRRLPCPEPRGAAAFPSSPSSPPPQQSVHPRGHPATISNQPIPALSPRFPPWPKHPGVYCVLLVGTAFLGRPLSTPGKPPDLKRKNSDAQSRRQAPAFRLESDEGQQLALKDFAGRRVLLFFFPKASTPG